MNLLNRYVTKLAGFYLLIMLSACANQPPVPFGDVSKNMRTAQIFDKNAALNPITEPIPQDGLKAQIVIDTFWEVGREKKQINNSIDINVGN